MRKASNGTYESLFRRTDMRPLHISLRTKNRREAVERHQAVHRVVREGRWELVKQLREGVVTVERLASMVRHQEPLVPVTTAAPMASVHIWENVDAAVARYLRWMADHPKRAGQTTNLAGYQLARFQNFEQNGRRLGELALDRVASGDVQAYQRSMVDAQTSPNTITTYMARVSALFTWCIETERREAREQRRTARELHSPVIADMLYRENRRRDRMLTVEEGKRLLAATPANLLWYVGCGLYAGLRSGETLHLRPGLDVDLELGTITIRSQTDWKPKTKRSHRMVPMAPQLLEIAKQHAAKYGNEAWMLPSPTDPTYPITEDATRVYLKAIVERAGMTYGRDEPRGVTYHTLRHSFASHAVMRGVDLYTVAKLLGDSVKMVEDVYADLSPDHKRAAVVKLAGAFSDTASDTEEGSE